MKAREPPEVQTIVRSGYPYSDYPFKAIGIEAQEMFARAYTHVPGSSKRASALPITIECVAQICDLEIGSPSSAIADLWRLCLLYVGAINSSKFTQNGHQLRHAQTLAFCGAIKWLRAEGFLVPPLQIESSSKGTTPSIAPFVDLFESVDLNAKLVRVWQGWWCHNRKGHEFALPFYPLYQRFGLGFADKLHELTSAWARHRNVQTLPIVRPIVEFIDTYPAEFKASEFQDPDFMTDFWIKFVQHYIPSRLANGNELATTLSDWNRSGQAFVHECLEMSGLFAVPSGGMPVVVRRHKPGSATRIKKTEDGTLVKTRLLTEVPLHVSDEEAIQILFQQIEQDIGHVEKWAWACVQEFNAAVDNRPLLAKAGIARVIGRVGTNEPGGKFISAPENPDALKNAAATFHKHGYQTPRDAPIALLYPKPIPETARRLGIPTSGTLLPHLAILVIEHPLLTEAHFADFELFSRSGALVGIVDSGDSRYMVGVKLRAGREHRICLSERAREAVRGILAATQPLRDYLRARGDDQWRYLVLNSGKSFSYPTRTRSFGGMTCPPQNERFVKRSMERVLDLAPDDLVRLVASFSLSRLRASCGVRVYIRTGSLQAMSEALGHVEFNPDLIDHYLPVPIQRFFQERWIRLFQNGLLVEALSGHDLQLEVSGFKSMQELHEFLKHHAYKHLKSVPDQQREANNDALVFGLNEETLCILFGLRDAVEKASGPVHPLARYWASITDRLEEYVVCEDSGREDIRAIFESAYGRSTRERFDRFIYGA